MRSELCVSLESALGGFFFLLVPNNFPRAHFISTATILAPCSHHPCSPGLRPTGLTSKSTRHHRDLWRIQSERLLPFFWSQHLQRNGVRSQGPRDLGPACLSCVSHCRHSRDRNMSCPRTLILAASSTWEACPYPPFHLCFSSSFSLGLNIPSQRSLACSLPPSRWSCCFLSWH